MPIVSFFVSIFLMEASLTSTLNRAASFSSNVRFSYLWGFTLRPLHLLLRWCYDMQPIGPEEWNRIQGGNVRVSSWVKIYEGGGSSLRVEAAKYELYSLLSCGLYGGSVKNR